MANLSEEQVREIIRDELSFFLKRDKYIFDKHIQILNGRNIQLSTDVGTKIGTDNTQKLGFYGNMPVSQQGAITDPTGGLTVDSPARSAIASILTALRNLGIIST